MPTQSVDPRTGGEFGPVFPDSTPDDVDAILGRATTASPQWEALPDGERARALLACADALRAKGRALAVLAESETALGVTRLEAEVARAAYQFETFADLVGGGRHHGVVVDPEEPGPPPHGHPDIRRTLVPIGPIAVFGASNFPFAFGVAGGDTSSALAAGCTVIVKAHPAHPSTSQRCADLLHEALTTHGAPEGTFSVVHGLEAGRQLVLDPRISAAAFTGSHAGGRALFNLCTSREQPIPFYGELGSVNPVVVLPSAVARRRHEIVEGYVASLTLGAGQFCTNPGLLMVPASGAIVDDIVPLVERQPVQTMLSRASRTLLQDQQKKVLALTGARVIAEGESSGNGFGAAVTLIAVPLSTALANPETLATECFGPTGILVEYNEPHEVLPLIAALPGCLVGTVHADTRDDAGEAMVAALSKRAGRVVWNGWPTGVAVTPAQQHGGPYPASTNALHTSVGTASISRFLRPVAYQSFPADRLPEALRPVS